MTTWASSSSGWEVMLWVDLFIDASGLESESADPDRSEDPETPEAPSCRASLTLSMPSSRSVAMIETSRRPPSSLQIAENSCRSASRARMPGMVSAWLRGTLSTSLTVSVTRPIWPPPGSATTTMR